MSARKIIVGYDRSADSQAAAAWALDEAARTGALVEFFYAYQWPLWVPVAPIVPAPADYPDDETDRAVKGALNDAVTTARLSHPEVRTETSIAYADAALTLVERSAEAGLIVLGSQGHSGVAGLIGSTSIAVSAHARCPVIVVKKLPDPDARVVVGVDDSPVAESVLAFAVEQAAARHVPLTVIRAWPPVTGLWEDTSPAARPVTDQQRRSLDDLVAGRPEKHRDLTISAVALAEHPVAALTRASLDAQLLVVGSRGRGALRGLLLGSVSQNVLHHAGCTVAIVHDAPS
jgi:nucleotide-binding universal stress UspA family protein